MTALAIEAPFAFANATSFGKSPKMPLNEAQFEAFYRSTASSVWSYIYRMVGNAALADDLLQKTFFRFLRSNPAVSNDDHLRRYVYKTATNLVFDHFREAKRQRSIPELSVPEIRTDTHELRHDMMKVFAELKPQERALLWLAHVEGCSHAEIAETIGAKEKSIKVMLFRARKRLGDLLSKRGLAPA
jgi:RNA polymerase sigma-70 factor (ECF subfamily)